MVGKGNIFTHHLVETKTGRIVGYKYPYAPIGGMKLWRKIKGKQLKGYLKMANCKP